MLIGRKTIGTVSFMGGIMSIPTPFVKSWQELIEYNSEYFVGLDSRISYSHATVSYHSFARNSLVDQMRGDWLLQLDTDIVFEPDILVRMLKKMNTHNIDVMVAPYLYKSEPFPPMLYGWDKKKREKFMIAKWDTNSELVRVWGAGGGCLLARKSVFDKIKKKLGESPFDIYTDKQGSPHSEDHSFFHRCQKLRIPVYFSPEITVKHLKYRELDFYKDFKVSEQSISKEKIISGGFKTKYIK